MAAINNTIPRQKGIEGYSYKDFMPKMYAKRHNKEQLPKSSPEIMKERVERYNRQHPNKQPLVFDYDKFKN